MQSSIGFTRVFFIFEDASYSGLPKKVYEKNNKNYNRCGIAPAGC